ncbi:MAG: hypothetical protein J6J53_02210, partial [Muribaculaceae bacterium]|nr:hypothetical protein [Muribaculaceae bacterium]
MDEHQVFFTVEVGRAPGLTDSTIFAPVEQEGAEVFSNYHDTFLALGRKPIEVLLTIFFWRVS